MNKYKSGNNLPIIGIVGATGLVGRTFLNVIEERNLSYKELRLFASKNSAGKQITFRGQNLTINETTPEIFDDLDFALFSAGGSTSLKFAKIAAEKKCIVVDNSSAWRMNPEVPLVVPEVNPEALENHNYIIANPNCSTIQMVVALKPLSDKYGLKRIICSTYQSISGAGQKGIDKLENELSGKFSDEKQIAYSTLFHSFDEGETFTNEEIKMINETRKIMNLPLLPIAVTCVRVPTIGGHGESLNIELNNEFEIDEIRRIFANSNGIILMDSPERDIYPTPAIAKDTDAVYVGRIRRDSTITNGLYLWIVSDNVRKGAATNAVQIVEKILETRI
jgi:aspartate-semialdehyde dehydrogenase